MVDLVAGHPFLPGGPAAGGDHGCRETAGHDGWGVRELMGPWPEVGWRAPTGRASGARRERRASAACARRMRRWAVPSARGRAAKRSGPLLRIINLQNTRLIIGRAVCVF